MLLLLSLFLVLLLLLTESVKAKEPKREKINGIRTDLQVSESICINAVGPVGYHKRAAPYPSLSLHAVHTNGLQSHLDILALISNNDDDGGGVASRISRTKHSKTYA